jgi:phospholipase C
MSDETLANLQKIDHIVVLMQENRSFDHMLGYLSLEAGRADVDGLAAGMKNVHDGRDYAVHHLPSTRFRPGQDPCHRGACVAQQMQNGMAGFVDNFAAEHPTDPDPGIVMGYYNAADLPVYDYLARTFAICDQWYCSVPGETWPNRLYAAAGRADGSLDNRQPVPIYDLATFPRHLDERGVHWRWYYHDVPTLRLMDARYRFAFSSFATFEQRRFGEPKTFLDAAKDDQLPAVCWIDPNFTDIDRIGPSGSNDDHPPSDVRDGQDLVLAIYHALATSKAWETSLLMVVYDDRGGLYDHVSPPSAIDDDPRFLRYGPRVPAIAASPWIESGTVSRLLFDHTSLTRTILERFCRHPDGTIPDMGARVAAANHLGSLLSRSTPTPAPTAAELEPLIAAAADHRAATFRERLLAATSPDSPPPQLDDFQQGLVNAMHALDHDGHPS